MRLSNGHWARLVENFGIRVQPYFWIKITVNSSVQALWGGGDFN